MFKVGDKIKCVGRGSSRVLVVGGVYTISELIPLDCVRVREVEIMHSYYSNQFVKVSQFKGNK